MPVIECSCGMMMSVPATGSRCCCIRCGGVEFRVVEKWCDIRREATPAMVRPPIDRGALPPPDLAAIGLAIVGPVDGVTHILGFGVEGGIG